MRRKGFGTHTISGLPYITRTSFDVGVTGAGRPEAAIVQYRERIVWLLDLVPFLS